MSGVGVTGLIKPLNGGAFPTHEDGDGLGGFRVVADNAERDAIQANFRKPGMMVYSRLTKCFYVLNADGATWEFLTSNQSELAKQSAWFISPFGNDNADGKTSGTALFSTEEIGRRMCPNGQRIELQQNTTIHVAAGGNPVTQGLLCLNIGWPASVSVFGQELRVVYEVSSSAPITLTGSVNTNAATETRCLLTTASGTFVNKRLIRVTSGAANKAYAYSTGLNGSAQSTFATAFVEYDSSSGPFPSIGDTVVVDTPLVTQKQLVIKSDGNGFVTIQTAIISKTFTDSDGYGNVSSGGSIFFLACELNQAERAAGLFQSKTGESMWACRNTGPIVLRGGNWTWVGGSNQHILRVAPFTSINYGDVVNGTIDGGCLIVGTTTSSNVYGLAHVRGSPELCNGASAVGPNGAAIVVTNGSSFGIGNHCWSDPSSTTPFAQGISSNGWVYFSGGFGFYHTHATADFVLNGQIVTVAQLPRLYSNNCGVTIIPDGLATPLPR